MVVNQVVTQAVLFIVILNAHPYVQILVKKVVAQYVMIRVVLLYVHPHVWVVVRNVFPLVAVPVIQPLMGLQIFLRINEKRGNYR